MREHSLRLEGTAAWAICVSKLYICVFFVCVASLTSLRAQTLPLFHGERVDYDLYFKWGLIMSKAGLATLSVEDSEYQGASAWRYNLLFRSAGVIEKVFSMRDTMDCYYSKASGSCSARNVRTRGIIIWWITFVLIIRKRIGYRSTRSGITDERPRSIRC